MPTMPTMVSVPSPTISPYDSAMSEITLRNQRKSPLIRLPAELRNKIYTYVGLSTVIRVDVALIPLPPLPPINSVYFWMPEMLEVSKQIRQEATSLIWKSAVFDFAGWRNAWWLHLGCKHELGEFATSIRIDYSLAKSLSYANQGSQRYLEEYKSPIRWMPKLEKVLITHNKYGLQTDDDRIRAAVRAWCEKDNLEVIFETP